jgi:hypothetical protein
MLAQHGPERVMSAVDELADRVNIGPDDEIGSSDVSGWVREIERDLNEQGVAEGEGGFDIEDMVMDQYRNGNDVWEIAQYLGIGEDEVQDIIDSNEQGVAEAEKKGLYYNVNKRKQAGTSRDKNHPKAPTAQAWKDAAKTAKTEGYEIDEAGYPEMRNADGLTQTEWMQKIRSAGGKIVAQAKMPNGPMLGMLNGQKVTWTPSAEDRSGVSEAEYQGRKVTLNKPMSNTDGASKSKVYVKDPQTGNVKKVTFGDPNMRIRKSNPGARKNFRARHNCANPGPKTKARYWSCRAW